MRWYCCWPVRGARCITVLWFAPARGRVCNHLEAPGLQHAPATRHCSLAPADWATVEPLKYLGPFLEVIKSPDTSGPITGVALTSVCRMLDQYGIGAPSKGFLSKSEIRQCSLPGLICRGLSYWSRGLTFPGGCDASSEALAHFFRNKTLAFSLDRLLTQPL